MFLKLLLKNVCLTIDKFQLNTTRIDLQLTVDFLIRHNDEISQTMLTNYIFFYFLIAIQTTVKTIFYSCCLIRVEWGVYAFPSSVYHISCKQRPLPVFAMFSLLLRVARWLLVILKSNVYHWCIYSKYKTDEWELISLNFIYSHFLLD